MFWQKSLTLAIIFNLIFAANIFAQTSNSAEDFEDSAAPQNLNNDVPDPNSVPSQNIESIIAPALPRPFPPLLNDRPPIPVPSPTVTLPADVESTPAKLPLAWRCKAYTMSAEKSVVGNKLSWSLSIPFEQSKQLLVSALNQMGFQVLAAYETAGQYLATTDDNSHLEIIIVAQSISPSQTAFQLRVFPERRRKEAKRLEELPVVMNTLVGNKGLL